MALHPMMIAEICRNINARCKPRWKARENLLFVGAREAGEGYAKHIPTFIHTSPLLSTSFSPLPCICSARVLYRPEPSVMLANHPLCLASSCMFLWLIDTVLSSLTDSALSLRLLPYWFCYIFLCGLACIVFACADSLNVHSIFVIRSLFRQHCFHAGWLAFCFQR